MQLQVGKKYIDDRGRVIEIIHGRGKCFVGMSDDETYVEVYHVDGRSIVENSDLVGENVGPAPGDILDYSGELYIVLGPLDTNIVVASASDGTLNTVTPPVAASAIRHRSQVPRRTLAAADAIRAAHAFFGAMPNEVSPHTHDDGRNYWHLRNVKTVVMPL